MRTDAFPILHHSLKLTAQVLSRVRRMISSEESSPEVHEDGPTGGTIAASRGDGHESEQLRRHAHA